LRHIIRAPFCAGAYPKDPSSLTIRPVNYERPSEFKSAIRLLSVAESQALGGGTDLLVTIREGLAAPRSLVDLRGLPGSATIAPGPDGTLTIGAGALIADIAGDARVREHFPALAQACESVGSPALRNMGTLGGNLCQRPRCPYFRSAVPCLKSNGSDCPAAKGDHTHHAIFGGGPCIAVNPSDPAVALTALDATVVINGPRGERHVPIDAFFVLPDPDPRRENVLDAGEFLTAIVLPAHSSGGRQFYTKVLQRGAWDFALASLAAVQRSDGSVRMVFGGVAPVPWRVNPSVEEDVASAPLSFDDLDVLAERALYDAQPLARNGYKVSLLKSLLIDAIARMQGIARETGRAGN
jgi:xanthine dehydrogenase YagS FAD-binding subunit